MPRAVRIVGEPGLRHPAQATIEEVLMKRTEGRRETAAPRAVEQKRVRADVEEPRKLTDKQLGQVVGGIGIKGHLPNLRG